MKTNTPIATILFAASLLALPCFAQEKNSGKDPYKKSGDKVVAPQAQDPFADNEADTPIVLQICYEDFSLPLTSAAEVLRRNLNGKDLYSWVLAECKAQTAKQETLVILKGRSGQKCVFEGISEKIYPSEYEQVGIPTTLGISAVPKDSNDKGAPKPVLDSAKQQNAASAESLTGLVFPALPASFKTRNVGVSVEAEPMIASSLNVVDIRIMPQRITDAGRSSWSKGVSEVEMANFEMQTLTATVTVKVGVPLLLGTMNRPPGSAADPDSANRVWFAFVTVTIDEL